MTEEQKPTVLRRVCKAPLSVDLSGEALAMLQKSTQTLFFCADSIPNEELSDLNILNCV